MAITPESLFDAFLRRIRRECTEPLKITPRMLHRLFYIAYLKFPDEMRSFQFLLRTEPYSPTLARLVWEFQQANQLGRINPDYTGYLVKAEGDAMAEEGEDIRPVIDSLVGELKLNESAECNPE
jgi:hypothetical protein